MKITAKTIIAAAAKQHGVDIAELTIQTFINGMEIDPAEKIDMATAEMYDGLDAWTADVRDTVEADNCAHEPEGTEWNLKISTQEGEVIACGSAYSEAQD